MKIEKEKKQRKKVMTHEMLLPAKVRSHIAKVDSLIIMHSIPLICTYF